MQYGDEQCRNVESMMTTPVARGGDVHRDAGTARAAVDVQAA